MVATGGVDAVFVGDHLPELKEEEFTLENVYSSRGNFREIESFWIFQPTFAVLRAPGGGRRKNARNSNFSCV